MSAATGAIPPPVSWAQRADLVYVIIDVECKDIEHKVTPNSFYFKGVNATDPKIKYEVTLNFKHPVDETRVQSKNIGRCLEFTIYKKEAGPYWSSLTADKHKLHFLNTNFTKWKNESDDEEDDKGLPAFPSFGGPNSDFKFDDFNPDEEDDDSDDNIPGLTENDEDEAELPKEDIANETSKVPKEEIKG